MKIILYERVNRVETEITDMSNTNCTFFEKKIFRDGQL